MASTQGINLRNNNSSSTKQSFLPPRSPFPSPIAQNYIDPGTIGSKPNTNTKLGQRHSFHHRNASESFLEEQPSWLDDLLNEPETPVRRGGHRRSSSDSFTFFDGASVYSSDLTGSTWGGTVESNNLRYPDLNLAGRTHGRVWESPVASTGFHRQNNGKEKVVPRDADVLAPDSSVKKEKEEPGQEQRGNSAAERKENPHAKHMQSEADTKRAKQQYAQRSRVRKLQYIAELERKVQTLQAEGMEVSAEMEFLSQQNIMLDLENKALKQRLESLNQEQLIKRFQQEMFEREVARLRNIYQQQQQQQMQQQQQTAGMHSRSSSRDLDSQFASLSLKHKEPPTNSGREPVSGPLRI
ncbi:basic-leucine zipper (bZIP) transcription factor family protein [Carex rostrata]